MRAKTTKQALSGQKKDSLAYLLAVVGVRSIEELDAGEGAGELTAAGDPGNGGALIEQEAGVEELDALLLDESYSQHLALLLVRDQLGGQHLLQHSSADQQCKMCMSIVRASHLVEWDLSAAMMLFSGVC